MKCTLLFFIILALTSPIQGQQLEPRVIGLPVGTDAEQNTVAFIDNNHNIICSGAIIHTQWIATSATCTKKMQGVQVRFQLANNLLATEAINRFLFALRINNAIPHPSFNEATLTNDVGLVETLDWFNMTSMPLQIPVIDSNYMDKQLILRGAGKYFVNNLPTDPTTVVEKAVYIADNKWCQRYVTMIPTKMCSYYSDACSGDQGAPLMTTDRKELVGVVSISNGLAYMCGAQSPVPIVTYTKLFGFKAWIRKTTGIMHL